MNAMENLSQVSGENEFLIWVSGDRHYALELAACQEVVNDVLITRLPKAPKYVQGLGNLRGTVISISDLEVLLGYRKEVKHSDTCSIIRIRTDGYALAVAVDSVKDAVAIREEDIEAAPANLTEAEGNYIRKVIKIQEGLALVPDFELITTGIYHTKQIK